MKTILSALVAVICLAFPAFAESRVALIVANSEYESSIGRLANPANDAVLMKEALETNSFSVTVVKDVDQRGLRRALRDHSDRIESAGEDAVSFFYYSGHGAADPEADGNYLVPIGAEMKRPRDLAIEAVSVNDIVQSFAQSTQNFIVIDACRNFPFPYADSRSIQKGLVPVIERRGTLIAFATSPGTTASDAGAGGGPYAQALARQLKTPGANHVSVFKGVQIDVMEATDGVQFPWFRDGVPGIFSFSAAPAAQPTAPILTSTTTTAPPTTSTGAGAGPDLAQAVFVDARFALATTPAPIVTSDPAKLKDFALFKECETCADMVVLPGGAFKMSGTDATWREYATEPPVDAEVTRFAVSRFEMTYPEWFACYDAGTCPKIGFHDEEKLRSSAFENRPFILNWANKLNADYNHETAVAATELDSDNTSPVIEPLLYYFRTTYGAKYRLLSEPEWEYAMKAGAVSEYYWGDERPIRNPSRENGAQVPNKESETGYLEPVNVGSFRPNKFGLFDMIGNVWELTTACLESDPYTRIARQCGGYVKRGGGYFDGPWDGSVNSEPIRYDNSLLRTGLRLARTL